MGSTSRGRVEDSKICLVLFSESVDDDIRAFFSFEACFYTLCSADVASDDKSSEQESKSYSQNRLVVII